MLINNISSLTGLAESFEERFLPTFSPYGTFDGSFEENLFIVFYQHLVPTGLLTVHSERIYSLFSTNI
jgi:hypothetical protein